MSELMYTQLIGVTAGMGPGIIIGFILCAILLQRAIIHSTMHALMLSQKGGPAPGGGPTEDGEQLKVKSLHEIHVEGKRKQEATKNDAQDKPQEG